MCYDLLRFSLCSSICAMACKLRFYISSLLVVALSPPHTASRRKTKPPTNKTQPPLQASSKEARRKAYTSIGYMLQLSSGNPYPGLYTTINNNNNEERVEDLTWWRRKKGPELQGQGIEGIWTCIFLECEKSDGWRSDLEYPSGTALLDQFDLLFNLAEENKQRCRRW